VLPPTGQICCRLLERLLRDPAQPLHSQLRATCTRRLSRALRVCSGEAGQVHVHGVCATPCTPTYWVWQRATMARNRARALVAGSDMSALASSASSLSNTGAPMPLGQRRTTHVTSPPHESPRRRTSSIAGPAHTLSQCAHGRRSCLNWQGDTLSTHGTAHAYRPPVSAIPEATEDTPWRYIASSQAYQ